MQTSQQETASAVVTDTAARESGQADRDAQVPVGIPPYEARRFLSFECAARWRVLPVSYDDKKDELTVAVHDASQVERLRQFHRFFLQSHRLNFRQVPREQIEGVFREHFSNRAEAARRWGLRPVRSGSRATDAGAPGGETRQRTMPPARPRDPNAKVYRYGAMSRALSSAVALLVTRELEDETIRLDEARARVRYCQLLAARMHVSVAEMDAVVLAAWISAPEDPVPTLSMLETPYPLQEILSQTKLGARPTRIESQILNLVNAYQDIKRQDPAVSSNITMTRRHLKQRCAFSPQNGRMLEVFLQILMDEDFLTKLDSGCGRILVADPSEAVESLLTPPLIGDGYEVEVVAGARAAAEKLEHFAADMVIASTTLSDGDGISLCRKLKQGSRRPNTPVIVIAPARDDKVQADALRAGADDFLVKPINLELLFLKIQRALAAAPPSENGPGVKGRLRDMSFSDLVQILSAGGKKMEITVAGKPGRARVLLDGANVLHAEVGRTKGPQAFYSLMTWPDGEFTAQQCSMQEEPTMSASVMALLMEGARRCDEGIPATG